jgi:carboxyl-terminal processing protease
MKYCILLVLFFSQNIVKAEQSYEEVMWAPTKLRPLMLDNTISFGYCSYEATRFRGCAAAVEKFATSLNIANELELRADGFHIGQSDNYKLHSTHFKKYQEYQRVKLTNFEKNWNKENTESLVQVYKSLRDLNPTPKPHEIARALNEFFAVAYDPHKQYIPMVKYNGQLRVTLKPFIGVELKLNNKNQLVISNVIMNTAAEKAGLKTGDIITHVNNNLLALDENVNLETIFDFKEDEKVKLNIARKNKFFDVNVVFGFASTGTIIDREIKFNNENYSYFYMGEVPSDLDPLPTCNVFSNILKNFNTKSDGLILDLRGNVGGPGETAACIAGLFLGKNTHIYSEVDLSDVTSEKMVGLLPKAFKKKMVVLVNSQTASSGEIIAASLKFHGRALILGDRTFGKAIGQTQEDYSTEKVSFSETALKALQPDGTSYHAKGVVPDYYIFRDGLKISEDEKDELREEDIALFPLKISDGTFYKKKAVSPKFPSACATEKSVRENLEKLSETNWKKDFQLQFALKTLSCLK